MGRLFWKFFLFTGLAQLAGIVAIVIALVADLPDAHATGLLRGAGGYSIAKDIPKAGLYLETLGAALLVVTSGAGLLIAGSR